MMYSLIIIWLGVNSLGESCIDNSLSLSFVSIVGIAAIA